MKKLITYLLVVFVTTAFGQTKKDSSLNDTFGNKYIAPADTALRIVYVDKNKNYKQPAFFINGKQIAANPNTSNTNYPGTLNNLNLDLIKDIYVVGTDTLIDNVSYKGQIYITMKSDYYTYHPKFISLKELIAKYTSFAGKQVVFMLDENYINANYDKYLIDENNLLTIEIDELKTINKKTEIGLIKLLTKSPKNIKDRNTIMIRGTDVGMN